MNLLNVPLPDDFAAAALAGENVRLCVEADVLEDGTLGQQWLVVTDRQALVLSRNGAGTGISWIRPLEKISEPKAQSYIGGGALEVTADEEKQVLVRYTSARAGQFGTVVHLLEKWLNGEEAEVPEEESHRCPTCGLPLRKGSNICSACSPKGRTLKRLLGYLRYVKGTAIALLLTSLAGTGMGLLINYLQKPLMDRVFVPQATHGVMPTTNERLQSLVIIFVIMILTHALVGVLSVLQGWLSALLGNRVNHYIRSQLFQHLQYLSLGYYDKRQMGTVISRVNQDSGQLQHFLNWGSSDLLGNILLLVSAGSYMLVTNWKLALLVVLPIPIISLTAGRVWHRIRHTMHRVFRRWGLLNAMLIESLNGLRVVKAFTAEPREIKHFDTQSSELVKPTVMVERVWSTMFASISFMFALAIALIWLFGGRVVVFGQGLSLGDLMVFIGLANMFMAPLRFLSMLLNWSSRSIAAAERIFEVLDTEPEPHVAEAVVMPQIDGKLEFHDVTFGYDRARTALKELSFVLEPGEMIGLVGHSGAGKTTIINLVCRFYEPQQGEILCDGLRIADLPLEAWRGQIGLVPQDTFLFSGTIAENIAYAKPGATREEIIRAAKIANAHDFVLRKPDGYDTLVGEGGMGLSAGEKQRIAIARAVLHDPRILILDEATSQVDVETEKQIQEAIDRLIAGRTTIAIAHRLSTLKNAHRLIVLKDGAVMEIGTHDELLQKEDGEFRRLVTMYQEVSKVREVGR